ncbi:MAG: epoxyqueuosine reductase [Chloroflexi bacterium]|nr:epoxyqueuosine reductase [Chloroflexota bacterium]
MVLSPQAKASFQAEPAHYIEQEIKSFTTASPACRLSFMNGLMMYDEPLVRFADGDDPIFSEFKSIIASNHLTPREALAEACNKRPEEMPARLSVISWILPISEKIRRSNYVESRLPSRLWSHTRWYGEIFNDNLRMRLVEFLTGMGYLATAPVLQPFFKMRTDENGPSSNWSERHVAYAAGHGTFSLSDGFISERGIAQRCGNVVTSLELPASPRTARSPYSNCLFYLGTNCRACIERCPAGAITEKGHDKKKCQQYMRDNVGSLDALKRDGYDNDRSLIGCGLCQTKVPCEYRNPAQKLTA